MGLAASKVCKQVPDKDLQEGSIPSTPIVTPKVLKHEDLDPRSPSMHISRTPLQLLSAATLKLEENNLTAPADETPAKPKTILLGIDPRSPTAEFKRTPIIVNVPESDGLEKIRNKNLDKVKRSVILTTPRSSSKKVVPPKLLESSPIKTKQDVNKRKSFVGLLETNIDFTETDLDMVIREKSKANERLEVLSEAAVPRHTQLINVVQNDNIDPRSPTNDFLRTPIQITKKIADLDLNNTIDFESESQCIGMEIKHNEIAAELGDHVIVRECIQEICEKVHLRMVEVNTDEKQLVQNGTNGNLPSDELAGESNSGKSDNEVEAVENEDSPEIPTEAKSAPITPSTIDGNVKMKPSVTKETKSAPVTPPVNLTADVKEFDKKLTSLIYHDEDIVICPRKVTLKDYDTRSPLRNLNSNEPEKKPAYKSKVNDKIKSEFAVSKIPVFKDKCKKTEVQCENTPPRNLERRKVKVRKSRWDNNDATLII